MSLKEIIYLNTNTIRNLKDDSTKIKNLSEKVFFTKIALGKDKKEIKLKKFRSMHYNADKKYKEIVANKGLDSLGKPNRDNRIIPFMRFFRSIGFDELPQLYNIFIKRDMSLVGIRPRNQEEWKEYEEEIKEKALQYKPGLVSPTYSIKTEDFNEHKEIQEQYLEEKSKSPMKTDVKYFFKVMKSIIFDGVRSR